MGGLFVLVHRPVYETPHNDIKICVCARHDSVLFAPTGPIQEVSLTSGWANPFLKVAERFDNAEKSPWSSAAQPIIRADLCEKPGSPLNFDVERQLPLA